MVSDETLLPPTKEEVNAFARVCLLATPGPTQKRLHEFGWNVACRQNRNIDELIDFWAQ